MALKTLVKVGNISNLSDARYCAGMGVDFLGFNIDPANEHYVDPEEFKEITKWVSGPEFVGELTDSNDGSQTDFYNFTFLQVDQPALIPAYDHKMILEVDLTEHSDVDVTNILDQWSNRVEYFLLYHSKSDHLDDGMIHSLKKWASNHPVLLGSGITPNNLEDLMNIGIRGIALYGSREAKPGLKDYDELADILEALEVEE